MKKLHEFISDHSIHLILSVFVLLACIVLAADILMVVDCVTNTFREEETENVPITASIRQDISDSSVHGDIYLPPVVDSDPITDTTVEKETDWYLTREFLIDYAAENYGVSQEWMMWLIGTTWREDYHEDRYLEYAWACEIFNEYLYYSVWQLDGIWGNYYSIENAFNGYYAADYTCLEMVWYAMTDRDTRICEVDGMIRWYVPGYYLIYDSDIYNCQVWGR